MDALVERYGMQSHPEGGFFVEWYGSEDTISSDLPERYGAGATRKCATAILYLCPKGGKSALHKIKGDELWMWHSGDPLTVVELLPNESGKAAGVRHTLVGPATVSGQTFVHAVKAGTYFGAFCEDSTSTQGYALVTCVVSPGFDYADWEMKPSAELRALYPGQAAGAAIDKLAIS